MKLPLMTDRDIRSIYWRDLVPLTRREVLHEVTLTLPWLFLSLLCAHHALWLLAAACSFVFFLTALRGAHDGQHYNLGLPHRATDVFMGVLSLLMLGSLHAVQVNHLRHHRYCLGEKDFEASSARMRWWQAILYGPVFFAMVHVNGWRHGNRAQRRWIIAETAGFTMLVGWILIWQPATVLVYHMTAMLVGQCFTAFFAVWTVHHDVDLDKTLARTERGWRNRLFYNMFFHLEHHLFPRVPTRHLPDLAARLDRVRPDLKSVTVLP